MNAPRGASSERLKFNCGALSVPCFIEVHLYTNALVGTRRQEHDWMAVNT